MRNLVATLLVSLALVVPATAAQARPHQVTFCYTVDVTIDGPGKHDLTFPVTVCRKMNDDRTDTEPWQF